MTQSIKKQRNYSKQNMTGVVKKSMYIQYKISIVETQFLYKMIHVYAINIHIQILYFKLHSTFKKYVLQLTI